MCRLCVCVRFVCRRVGWAFPCVAPGVCVLRAFVCVARLLAPLLDTRNFHPRVCGVRAWCVALLFSDINEPCLVWSGLWAGRNVFSVQYKIVTFRAAYDNVSGFFSTERCWISVACVTKPTNTLSSLVLVHLLE